MISIFQPFHPLNSKIPLLAPVSTFNQDYLSCAFIIHLHLLLVCLFKLFQLKEYWLLFGCSNLLLLIINFRFFWSIALLLLSTNLNIWLWFFFSKLLLYLFWFFFSKLLLYLFWFFFSKLLLYLFWFFFSKLLLLLG